MGQQQLLLLVLSTVIVGLATVAGIQAFDEGQTQAAQDALTQRALTIGSDIYGALEQPSQLGGISTDSDDASIAASAGYGESADDSGDNIPADGAGDGADCHIDSGPSAISVICADDGSGGNADGNQAVTVEIDNEGPSVATINGQSVGS
jgi:hypothetical protein